MSTRNYPSLYNDANTPVFAAYLESLHPRRAELFLFPGGDNRTELAKQCALDLIPVDEFVDVDNNEVESTMRIRASQGLKVIPAYLLPNWTLPVLQKASDFPPFDLPAFIAGGGAPMRELWIQVQAEDGTFVPGVDSTAYTINGTGNPKLNPRDLANSFVFCDKYGFRVAPETKGAIRYQIKMDGRGVWWFVAAPIVG